MTYSASKTELHYYDPANNHDKFYRVYAIRNEDDADDPFDLDARVLYQWGRRGTAGGSKVELTRTPESSAARKISSKLGNGYKVIETVDFGVCPPDVLRAAGVNERSQIMAERRIRADPLLSVKNDIDTVIRLAYGTTDELAQAIQLHQSMRERMDELQRRLSETQASLEMLDTIVMVQLG